MHFFGAAQEYFHAQEQFAHIEGLGNIIVGAALEPFYFIFLHRFGSQEEDGHEICLLPDFLGYGKTVFIGHHYIEQADIKIIFTKAINGHLAIRAMHYIITVFFQGVFNDKAQGRIVFGQ